MRGVYSTVGLLIVALGLGAYIYFVEMRRAPDADGPALERVFDLDAGRIEELRVRSEEGEIAELRRQDGAWALIAPEAAPADDVEVGGITSGLQSLEIQRLVVEEPEDLAPFGLDEPRVEVAFRLEGETEPLHLMIGEQTATGGDLYARASHRPGVFLISGWLDSTFNRSPFELRDKRILRFDRDAIDRIEIAGAQPLEVQRADDQWRLTSPLQARADFGTVQSLLSRLDNGRMRAIAAAEADDLGPWGLDRPELAVTLHAEGARHTFQVGRVSEEGTNYARDESRPVVFTVDSFLVDDLRKTPEDLRSRDVFDFRSYTATRFEAARQDTTIAYEKDLGEDGLEERWRRLEPDANVDHGAVQSMLSRFSGLRVVEFEPARRLDPVLTVTVGYDEDRRERVEFAREDERVYALREGEPGLLRVDTTDFDLAVKALDEIE